MTSQYSIMVVDIENFSSRSDPIQRSLRQAMYEVLRGAVADAGLEWQRMATEDRGDGVLLLIEPDQSLVVLVGDLVRTLDDQLAERAQGFSQAHALRLRVALHQGLATKDATGWSGDAVNTACRLVDAQVLRDVLAAASRGRLVFAVSQAVYDMGIRPGHRSIPTETFVPVEINVKQLRGFRAWVRVPGYPAPPEPAVAPYRPAPSAPTQPAARADHPGSREPAGGPGMAAATRAPTAVPASSGPVILGPVSIHGDDAFHQGPTYRGNGAADGARTAGPEVTDG